MSKKNFLLSDKKIRKNNQIPEYYVFSFKELMKIIYKQSIHEKSPNLIEN